MLSTEQIERVRAAVKAYHESEGRGAMSKLAALSGVTLQTMSRFKAGATDLRPLHFRQLELYLHDMGWLKREVSSESVTISSDQIELNDFGLIADDLEICANILRSDQYTPQQKAKRLAQLVLFYHGELVGSRLGLLAGARDKRISSQINGS